VLQAHIKVERAAQLMSTNIPEDILIRRYLLSRLPDEEREAVELRMVTDKAFNDEVEAAEQELVDQYLASELSDADRTLFEQNFYSTPHGREQVAFAEAFKRAVPPKEEAGGQKKTDFRPTPLLRPPEPQSAGRYTYLRYAAMLVVAVGAVFLIARLQTESDLEAGTRALREAYSKARPEPLRISSFAWAPYIKTRGDNTAPIDRNSLRRAELLLSSAIRNPKTAEEFHAAGQLHLANGDLDTAIRELTSATNAAPRIARYHNDLGVALLARSGADVRDGSSEPDPLVSRSLEEFEQAVRLDDRLLEALFNRAFCNQELGHYEEARRDWEAYLKKDETSEWANEARDKLRRVEEQLQKRTDNRRGFQFFPTVFEMSATTFHSPRSSFLQTRA
jgi:tetratricopeptide (TPR) repeat protein